MNMQQCPYCGAATRINTHRHRQGKVCPSIFEASQVKCKRNSCGMSGPLFKGENSRQRAQAHWDRCVFQNTAKGGTRP